MAVQRYGHKLILHTYFDKANSPYCMCRVYTATVTHTHTQSYYSHHHSAQAFLIKERSHDISGPSNPMLPSPVFCSLFCLLIQKHRTCLSSFHKETHHLFKEATSHIWSWAHNLFWNLEVPALTLEPLLSETIWVVHQNLLYLRLCFSRPLKDTCTSTLTGRGMED